MIIKVFTKAKLIKVEPEDETPNEISTVDQAIIAEKLREYADILHPTNKATLYVNRERQDDITQQMHDDFIDATNKGDLN